MGFSGQEHLIGLPCPSSWDLPNPGIEPACIIPPTLAGVFFTTAATQMQVQMQLLISRSCLVSKRLLDGVDDVGTGLWPLLSHQGCGCVSESATEVYISSSPSHLCIKFWIEAYAFIPKAMKICVQFVSLSWITALSWWRSLCNSMKLCAMPFKATQDRWVIVKCPDKMWSTVGGNGNPLQDSCSKKPMNIMKRQKGPLNHTK